MNLLDNSFHFAHNYKTGSPEMDRNPGQVFVQPETHLQKKKDAI